MCSQAQALTQQGRHDAPALTGVLLPWSCGLGDLAETAPAEPASSTHQQKLSAAC